MISMTTQGTRYSAHFLEALMEYGLKLEDVHPIGWSYGAHVVGEKWIDNAPSQQTLERRLWPLGWAASLGSPAWTQE